MKKLCFQNKIPTAKFKICINIKQVKDFLKSCAFPLVVKADGLASGKGVTICKSKRQTIKFSQEILMENLNLQKN